jgi:hypothetical protein
MVPPGRCWLSVHPEGDQSDSRSSARLRHSKNPPAPSLHASAAPKPSGQVLLMAQLTGVTRRVAAIDDEES